MKAWHWIALAWLTVLSAFWAACSIVYLSDEDACVMRGGEWNKAWSRCYP